MKKILFLFCITFAASVVSAQEQNATGDSSNVSTATSGDAAQAGITDEELKKYAITMDSVNDMKQSLLNQITTMVKENEKMTAGRYNELSKIIEDETKLTEAKATPEEIAFIKEVSRVKDEGAQAISDTFQKLAQDFVGAKTYNEIKNSLPTDDELKKRYDQIFSEVQSEDSASTK